MERKLNYMTAYVDNYIKLKKKWYSRYNEFLYVDVEEHLADDVFVKNKIPVKFTGDYKHDDEKYILVYCKVMPKYTEEFSNSLLKLKSKMYLNGYTDYESFCEKVLNQFR